MYNYFNNGKLASISEEEVIALYWDMFEAKLAKRGILVEMPKDKEKCLNDFCVEFMAWKSKREV